MSRLKLTPGVHWYSLTMTKEEWLFWLGIAFAVLIFATPPLMYLLKIGY